jgi:hypothetical protein
MRKSEKIKRELHSFWLKQLDQSKDNSIHSANDQPSQLTSTLASDPFFQRQLQRVSGRIKEKRPVNGSAVGAPNRHATAAESSRDAADKLRQWLSQNVAAEQFEGQFYVKQVDLLSLQQAKHDWNISAGNEDEACRSHPGCLAIDDRFCWLSAPSS